MEHAFINSSVSSQNCFAFLEETHVIKMIRGPSLKTVFFTPFSLRKNSGGSLPPTSNDAEAPHARLSERQFQNL